MPFVTMYDDDPDTGRPGYRTYEVLHVTGPGSISLVGEMTQKVHPISYLRAQGQSEAAEGSGPRTPCCTPGCRNKASEHHRDCSGCRSKRLAKCACGRRRSYGAERCALCVSADRRLKKRMARVLWDALV